MTRREWAKELYGRLGQSDKPLTISQLEAQDIAIIAAALDAMERETWEKAANKLEEQYNDSWAYSRLVEEFISWCRRQGGGE